MLSLPVPLPSAIDGSGTLFSRSLRRATRAPASRMITAYDYGIIAFYLALILAVGLAFRRLSRNTS